MECRYCHYNEAITVTDLKSKEDKMIGMCKITHLCYVRNCNYIASDEEIEDMNICYNCKYWYGGGDWGLSCEKNYYNCSTNGFDEACEQFERK